MAVLASDHVHTVILLLLDKKEAYPLSTLAFTRAQGSPRKISTNYRNALIVERDGRFFKFEAVDILGPVGTSLGRRALSYLTSTWRIQVKLSAQLDYSLDEAKSMLVGCMDSPLSADNFDFDNSNAHQKFIGSIRAAKSFDTLLTDLVLCAPENSLDVL
ncbi:hypothetical protein [Aquidulcibacter sp.]|uniref:hypothetical protein n=1 Tax=Aquidulcibacter sp. TaxID=2052990 RepID=UPI0025BEEC77|nr:hypothetical protein [Aquidulcibacter sp.]MCA3692812.1 hypothetical protein [Aquidulcibacter sp.]